MISLGLEGKNQTIYQLISDLDKDGAGAIGFAEFITIFLVYQFLEYDDRQNQ